MDFTKVNSQKLHFNGITDRGENCAITTRATLIEILYLGELIVSKTDAIHRAYEELKALLLIEPDLDLESFPECIRKTVRPRNSLDKPVATQSRL